MPQPCPNHALAAGRADRAAALLGVRPSILIRPVLIADQPGELKELPVQFGVLGPPFKTSPLHFVGGQRLSGQPGVVSVLGPDLDVDIPHDAAILPYGRLRNLQVSVRKSNDKHSRSP
jgi:hypothetical protein